MTNDGVSEKALKEWEEKQKYIRSKLRYEAEMDSWSKARILNGFKSFAFTAGLILSVWGLSKLAVWFRQWYLTQFTAEQQTMIGLAVIGTMVFIMIWLIAWSFINPPVPEDFRLNDD